MRLSKWFHPGGSARAAIAALALAAHSQAGAQIKETPPSRMQVVDSAGRPLADVAVVMRWEGMRFVPGGFHSSAHWAHTFKDDAFIERVSDAQGWVDVPAVRAKGEAMDPRSPKIMAFRSGFDPLLAESDGKPPARITLAPRNPSAVDHARRILKMQGDHGIGLRWTQTPTSSMPRMVAALHAEKMSMGEDGWAIMPVTSLPGRSGKGVLVRNDFAAYAKTRPHTPLHVVLEVRWRIVPAPGGAPRYLFRQKEIGAWDESTPFRVSPWSYPDPSPAGWRIDTEFVPTVRFFAAGYRKTDEFSWPEAGNQSVTMERHGDSREALLAELRAWRRHVEEAIARDGLDDAILGQAHLAGLLAQECARIAMDLRADICFEPGSPLELAAKRIVRNGSQPREDNQGTYAASNPRIADPTQVGQASPIGAMSVRIPTPVRAKPVDGFSVQPSRQAR